jgi:tetratricopeptide (TPR) repeat protein
VTNRFHKLELEESQQTQPPDLRAVKSRASAQQSAVQHFQQDELRDEKYWLTQADQNRRAGQYEDALRHYSRAVELNRSLVSAWVGQVQMLIMLGEYPEAELWARKALELFKSHAELQAARGQALCRKGDIKNAQVAVDQAISQPGLTAYPWLARGDVMLAQKDPVEEYCFDKAVQLDPDWLVLIEIALIYQFYRRHAKALTRCRQAVEKAPDQPFCWYQQGQCEAAMGLKSAARRSLKQCLDLQPKHPTARARLEELEGGVGSVRRAMRRWMGRE